MDRNTLQTLILEACSMDVRAFKPGNVSIGYGHADMTADDFIRSAQAILDPITAPKTSVGQRIEGAIEATRAVVDCNTNLGIVLLLAPIAKSVEDLEPPLLEEALQHALTDTLSALTQKDAEATFRAIRLAAPSGLGEVPEEDVGRAPQETLFKIMERAKPWDDIAKAYVTAYAALWTTGVDSLRHAILEGQALLWAVTDTYLGFMASTPDTHIQRRHGREKAEACQTKAQDLHRALRQCGDATIRWKQLQSFDFALKSQKINPGTSADMTIASVLLLHLLQLSGYNARRHAPLSQRFSARPALAFAEKSRGLDPQLL